MAAVATDYLKLGGSKQHMLISLQFWTKLTSLGQNPDDCILKAPSGGTKGEPDSELQQLFELLLLHADIHGPLLHEISNAAYCFSYHITFT